VIALSFCLSFCKQDNVTNAETDAWTKLDRRGQGLTLEAINFWW